MKSFYNPKYILMFLCIFYFSIACSTTNKEEIPSAPCIDENQKDLVINWGSTYERTGGKIYKSIQSNAIMYRIDEDSNGIKKYSDTVKISYENYCYIKQRIEKLAIQTQSMYYPGEIQEFIEYKSNYKNLSFRAFWNPKYIDHIENRIQLKSLYDSLPYLCR